MNSFFINSGGIPSPITDLTNLQPQAGLEAVSEGTSESFKGQSASKNSATGEFAGAKFGAKRNPYEAYDHGIYRSSAL